MADKLDRAAMEEVMKNVLDNQEFLEASMKPIAEMMYCKLKALIAAGFSRPEAMDLIKERGLNA